MNTGHKRVIHILCLTCAEVFQTVAGVPIRLAFPRPATPDWDYENNGPHVGKCPKHRKPLGDME